MDSINGQSIQIGSKMLISDTLLEQINDNLINTISDSLLSALVDKSIGDQLEPLKMELTKERDAPIKAWELMAIIDAKYHPTLTLLAVKLHDENLALSGQIHSLKTMPVFKYLWRKITGKL